MATETNVRRSFDGMAARLPQFVRERAAGRCESCRLPQQATSVPFELDHIISRKHHGPTILWGFPIAHRMVSYMIPRCCLTKLSLIRT
jgi:hypothetical protein